MSSDALIVFAKPPTPGRVKTRLTPVLSEEAAAALYAAFLKDALLQYAPLPVDVRLYLGDAAPSVEAWTQEHTDAEVHVQHGPGLGKRMARAFVESFAAGYERLVIIGTDHPTLPTPFIEQAFERLDTARAVTLGPSSDGGYYLLGMNDYFPELFHEMTYSHAQVFDETLARAHAAGAQVTILPPWYDVDEPADLHRLTEDLADRPSSVAPHTRAQLEALSPPGAQAPGRA
ncbi:MAG: DUF2064 domain-containing protein [Bacteroidetes bacterium]|jgi:rSAM/selenodomain-associated transferase 1|nr:DUF2064 domain-containing protein [Bacteroidota bacterium]